MASFTAVKLGLAAGLVLLAAILGIVFAEQAPTMAVTSTLSLTASSDSSSLGGITVGHS